jgi:actin-related protein
LVGDLKNKPQVIKTSKFFKKNSKCQPIIDGEIKIDNSDMRDIWDFCFDKVDKYDNKLIIISPTNLLQYQKLVEDLSETYNLKNFILKISSPLPLYAYGLSDKGI